MSRTDRRVIRTRKAIMDAFGELIAVQSIDTISISALARKANIDRKTFYLHYPSINALVNSFIQQHIERVLKVFKRHSYLPIEERLHPMLQEANAMFEENIDVWTHLADNLSTDEMIDIIANTLGPAVVNTGLAKEVDAGQLANVLALARLRYALAGALSLYTFWLKNGCKEPVEAVSKIVEDSARNGIYPLERRV
ncbi:MAG: TetR/AcrR family transcriptional regulator [Eggerthellaceae bacterium]|nr:TetR/AcrR family transcriptional regulator [Eggerthellaceae bacterium]